MDLSRLDNPAPLQSSRSLKIAPILPKHPGREFDSIADQVRPSVEDDLPQESDFSPGMTSLAFTMPFDQYTSILLTYTLQATDFQLSERAKGCGQPQKMIAWRKPGSQDRDGVM